MDNQDLVSETDQVGVLTLALQKIHQILLFRSESWCKDLVTHIDKIFATINKKSTVIEGDWAFFDGEAWIWSEDESWSREKAIEEATLNCDGAFKICKIKHGWPDFLFTCPITAEDFLNSINDLDEMFPQCLIAEEGLIVECSIQDVYKLQNMLDAVWKKWLEETDPVVNITTLIDEPEEFST